MPPANRLWPWLLACGLLFAAGVSHVPLLDPDEPRYATAAREMASTGDLIVPRFNDEPRLNKPPLLYWAQAALFAAGLGEEAAARIPSVLAALGAAALTGWWARRRLGATAALPAVASLATCLIFFACARLAITDMLLALWIAAALLLWHEAIAAGAAAERRRLSLAASLAAGLATLTKGPAAPSAAVLVILLTAALTRRRDMVTLRGIAMTAAGQLLVAGPWLAALIARVGPAGVVDLVRRELIGRAAGGMDHPRPFWYLLASFWVTFLPWSLAVPAAVWRLARERRAPAGRGLPAAEALPIAWLCGFLLFFSLPAGKNDAYLLPAAPALALIVARWLSARMVLAASAVTALVLAGALLAAAPRVSAARSLRQTVRSAGLDRRPAEMVIGYRLYRPSLVFYSGRPVRWIASGPELRRTLDALGPAAPVAIVMTGARRARLPRDLRARLEGFVTIGGQPGYVALYRGPAGGSSGAP